MTTVVVSVSGAPRCATTDVAELMLPHLLVPPARRGGAQPGPSAPPPPVPGFCSSLSGPKAPPLAERHVSMTTDRESNILFYSIEDDVRRHGDQHAAASLLP